MKTMDRLKKEKEEKLVDHDIRANEIN